MQCHFVKILNIYTCSSDFRESYAVVAEHLLLPQLSEECSVRLFYTVVDGQAPPQAREQLMGFIFI
jgi:hypothetical protein